MSNFTTKKEEIIARRKEELLNKSRQGKKIVTYVSPHIPVELLDASGVEYLAWEHFIGLYEATDSYINNSVPDEYFPKDWCLYSKANFILEVKEPKPKISLVVIAYTCDPITKMWEYLEKSYNIYYFNLSRSINESAIAYWTTTTKGLKEELEKLTGIKISGEKLKEAFDREVEIRKMLTDLRFAVYKKKNSGLMASEMMELLSLRKCLNQEQYLELLKDVSTLVGSAPAKDEKEIPCFLLLGSLLTEEAPKAMSKDIFSGVDLVKSIEKMNLGIRIIEEPWANFLVGEPYALPEGKEILTWIGENSYLRPKHPCLSPNLGRMEENQKLAQMIGAKGVIFFNYKGCRISLMESRLNEYIFNSEGIPYLHLQFSGRKRDVDNINVSIESFIVSNKNNG